MSDKLPKHYSGPMSKPFWDRVNALADPDHEAAYMLGCALQDLEGRALSYLELAESGRIESIKPLRDAHTRALALKKATTRETVSQ